MTGVNPDASSRKRRKKRDGEGSSASSVNSASEGRHNKSHHAGGISKFFSVFLNCCRAPDSSQSVGDEEGPRIAKKPHSITAGRRSTPGSAHAPKEGIKDTGVSSEPKDSVIDEKTRQDDPIKPEADARQIAPVALNSGDLQANNEEYRKPGFAAPAPGGEKVVIKEIPVDREVGLSTGQNHQVSVTVEPPTPVAAEEIEKIRPSTSSPAPQVVRGTGKSEDVDMPDADSAQKSVAFPKVDWSPAPIQDDEPQQQKSVDGASSDESLLAQDQTHGGATVESPVPEKKWLLPPLRPEFQGKKCLVLDLDETLVHSSFKVASHFRDPTYLCFY